MAQSRCCKNTLEIKNKQQPTKPPWHSTTSQKRDLISWEKWHIVRQSLNIIWFRVDCWERSGFLKGKITFRLRVLSIVRLLKDSTHKLHQYLVMAKDWVSAIEKVPILCPRCSKGQCSNSWLVAKSSCLHHLQWSRNKHKISYCVLAGGQDFSNVRVQTFLATCFTKQQRLLYWFCYSSDGWSEKEQENDFSRVFSQLKWAAG